MVRRVVEVIIDDLEGGDAAQTVKYALDGMNYEIDLNDKNADKLRADLHRFIAASRRIGGGVRGGHSRPRGGAVPGTARIDREQNKAIRAWAESKGIEVADRGRIPQVVVDRYHAEAGRR